MSRAMCAVRLLAATVLGIGAVAAGVAPATAAADSPTAVAVSSLPAPYSGWNVTVDPVDQDSHVLKVSFDSPLLGQRVTNTVYLPDDYRGGSAATPVVYALHGTVLSPLDNCAVSAATEVDTLLRMVGCGGAHLQDQLWDVRSQLGRMHFAVVSPDTDATKTICQTCAWIDGRKDLVPNVQPVTATEMPADSFLHKELYPLVETLFNLRSDRAGRGVIGFSMGGWAAALQVMMHPDDYSYVGDVSGIYDINDPVLTVNVSNALGYLRDQGYGTAATDPVWWRQFNPRDIATNLAHTDLSLLLTTGDGCLGVNELLTSPYCQGEFSPVRSANGSILEAQLDENRTIGVNDLTAKSIPFTTVRTAGSHGANNADMFSDRIVPGANERFADGASAPEVFRYDTAMQRFSVWGYDVDVDRPVDGFLHLRRVRADGTAFRLHGPGTVTVRTPARFDAGSSHVAVIRHDGTVTRRQVTAGPGGRITLQLASDGSVTRVRIR